jgi:transcriptional regulator with XRE-family HTH domain
MADTDREARERFAANIQRLRLRDGLSVELLAERAELDGRELREILRGEGEARYGTIALLAGALGVEPEELFQGIRWIPPEGDDRGRFEIEESGGGWATPG